MHFSNDGMAPTAKTGPAELAPGDRLRSGPFVNSAEDAALRGTVRRFSARRSTPG